MKRQKRLIGVYDTADNYRPMMVGTYDEIAKAFGKTKKAIKEACRKEAKIENRYALEKIGFEGGENE